MVSIKIEKIKNSNKSDNEKYEELKKIYDDVLRAKNNFNERWDFEGLLNSDMYVAYQFKKDLDKNIIKRDSLSLSALIFNDEIMDYVVGSFPEKNKYKQMLKDFMKETKDYFECLTYSNEIQSILSDTISVAQDIPKEELVKLYCSLENATSRSQIDDIIFNKMDKPIFKMKDGKYVFRSNLVKALDKAGDVLSIASTTLNGIQDICYVVSDIKAYQQYEDFLRNICNYKQDGKNMMPYAMRCAAYDLLYEMQGEFQAVAGNVLPILQEYTKFGVDQAVNVTQLTATGLLSSITTGISIGKLIGNIVLEMEDIVNSAAYVEGYAYLGELYSNILRKGKGAFLNNQSIENAEQFKKHYDTLLALRKKGEETYLDMVSLKNAWGKNYLKSWTGYKEKEEFCNSNIKRIEEFRFIIREETNFKITSKKETMKIGESYTFQATKEEIEWSISNTKLASIDSKTGKLKAKKAGTITVTAKAGGKSISCRVKINNKVNLGKISKEQTIDKELEEIWYGVWYDDDGNKILINQSNIGIDKYKISKIEKKDYSWFIYFKQENNKYLHVIDSRIPEELMSYGYNPHRDSYTGGNGLTKSP